MAYEISPDTAQSVAFIGNTLGPLFLYEPRTAQNVALYDGIAALDVEEAAAEWPFVDDGTAEKALTAMKAGIADDADGALLWEFRRLFVGPAAKAAPPWGSVYTDKDQVIFGASTLALRQWMRETGVAKTAADGDPEDHVGLMLLMMSWLAENRPNALASFLQDHFLTWAPHFMDVVQKETANPFFEGLAALSKSSLLGIQETLGLQVAVPRFYR